MLVIVVLAISQTRLGDGDVAAALAVPSDSLRRVIQNDSFGPGEFLNFDIGYGFVTAGNATLEIRDTVDYNGNLCFDFHSVTNSNKFFDSFYKVRDTILAYIDAEGVFAHYSKRILHEGSYHSEREICFEPEQRRAITRRGADDIDTVAIGAFFHDVISAFYYVRTLPLEIGQTIKLNYVGHDSVAVLDVHVLKRETVSVPAGEFKCIVVEPMLTSAGIFKNEGDVKVWLTDDRLKMPVLMKSKVIVGSIHAELREFRLGNLNW